MHCKTCLYLCLCPRTLTPSKSLDQLFVQLILVAIFAKRKKTVLRKFFPRDKNYILEEAQLSLEQSLLHYLTDFVKVEYLLRHNPLGIEDDLAKKIRSHGNDGSDLRHLHDFYVCLTGVFRFNHYSDNQLSFDFDGRDPFEKYCDEWTTAFRQWVREFCRHENFLRAVLDLTVFYPVDSPVIMVDNRMNNFIEQFFDIRIHPQKGIVRKSA